ncbi:pseudouridine synthase [Gammaproteobacteria bacterium 45_16_T64]|nr:pseudouridine synthase [Gammaproteobacteria bacterium 45_16_T64]
MGLSKYPSKVNLPQSNPGCVTVLEYLIKKFPGISPDIWRARIVDSKVHWLNNEPITLMTPYRPQGCVCYYREVEQEPVIPFEERILFQDDHVLLVFKPHFLPVTPGGKYVEECLQNRLRRRTGVDELQALHRLDRETAGLVLFSVNPKTRPQYHDLFASRTIHKTYQAVAEVGEVSGIIGKEWKISNRIVKSDPRFTMKITSGEANAHSTIKCLTERGGQGLFELLPISGKTHQLRLHMMSLGWPILHDRFYPVLQPESSDDYTRPLQLLAKRLQYIDPITCEHRDFVVDEELIINP